MSATAGDVIVTPLLSPVSVVAIYVTLGIILAIGLDLLLRKPGRRREEGRERAPLPEGVDPVSLRRRRPRAQKLSGAVLIAAVLVLLLALAPVLGG